MTNKISNTKGLAAPFGAYSHACEVPEGSRVLFLAGQVGVRPDGSIPDSVEEQCEIAFQNLLASLGEAGMGVDDIAKMMVALCDRNEIKSYRAARDRIIGDVRPPTTLLIVSGLANPAWKIEIEMVAARQGR